MKPKAGSIAALALFAALGAGACAERTTAPDPAEPGVSEDALESRALADTTAVSPTGERINFRARKKGIGTE